MLDQLISSKTRIKLMMKFFINENTTGYLRSLAGEFGESTNAIRLELNRFEEANLLTSQTEKNRKVYRANIRHPYYGEMHRLLLKYVGIDHLVEQVISRLGALQRAYVTGDFARGNPGKLLDLLLIGTRIDHNYLQSLIRKAEENVSFTIRCLTLTPDQEAEYIKNQEDVLLVWESDK